jgi:ABC-type uncharacterized transport system ATPase component
MTVNFAGQKLVVVGGSNGMGRDTAADVVAADVVAAGGSAVIIGQDQQRVDDTRLATLTTLTKAGQASWCSGEDWIQGGA